MKDAQPYEQLLGSITLMQALVVKLQQATANFSRVA